MVSTAKLSAWDRAPDPQALNVPAYRRWEEQEERRQRKVKAAPCQLDLDRNEREVSELAKFANVHERTRRRRAELAKADVDRTNKLLVRRICDVVRQSEKRQAEIVGSGNRRDCQDSVTLNYPLRRRRQLAINKENAALLQRLETTRPVVPSVVQSARTYERHVDRVAKTSRLRRRPLSLTATGCVGNMSTELKQPLQQETEQMMPVLPLQPKAPTQPPQIHLQKRPVHMHRQIVAASQSPLKSRVARVEDAPELDVMRDVEQAALRSEALVAQRTASETPRQRNLALTDTVDEAQSSSPAPTGEYSLSSKLVALAVAPAVASSPSALPEPPDSEEAGASDAAENASRAIVVQAVDEADEQGNDEDVYDDDFADDHEQEQDDEDDEAVDEDEEPGEGEGCEAQESAAVQNVMPASLDPAPDSDRRHAEKPSITSSSMEAASVTPTGAPRSSPRAQMGDAWAESSSPSRSNLPIRRHDEHDEKRSQQAEASRSRSRSRSPSPSPSRSPSLPQTASSRGSSLERAVGQAAAESVDDKAKAEGEEEESRSFASDFEAEVDGDDEQSVSDSNVA